MGDDGQVFAIARGLEVSHRAGAAPPFVEGQLKIPYPFLIGAIVVGVAFISGSNGRIEPFINDFALQTGGGYGQRTVLAALWTACVAALPSFGPFEIGQNIFPSPAGVAQLSPMVEIFRLPAHIEQPVDRATAP